MRLLLLEGATDIKCDDEERGCGRAAAAENNKPRRKVRKTNAAGRVETPAGSSVR